MELVNKDPYKASIGSMQLWLLELQEIDSDAQELRQQELQNGLYQDINRVLHHQGLLFVLKAIQTELICHYHNDLLAGYFGIK